MELSDFFGETDMCQGFGVWMLGAQEREHEQSEEFTTSTSFCSVTASSPDSPHLFHCFQKLPLLDDPRRPWWIKDSLTALQYIQQLLKVNKRSCLHQSIVALMAMPTSISSTLQMHKIFQLLDNFKMHTFPFPPFLSLLSALSLSIRESGSSPSPP